MTLSLRRPQTRRAQLSHSLHRQHQQSNRNTISRFPSLTILRPSLITLLPTTRLTTSLKSRQSHEITNPRRNITTRTRNQHHANHRRTSNPRPFIRLHRLLKHRLIRTNNTRLHHTRPLLRQQRLINHNKNHRRRHHSRSRKSARKKLRPSIFPRPNDMPRTVPNTAQKH